MIGCRSSGVLPCQVTSDVSKRHTNVRMSTINTHFMHAMRDKKGGQLQDTPIRERGLQRCMFVSVYLVF